VSGKSVLVVDDDPTILAAVSEFLDIEGYRVATATNGAEALDAVKQRHPAVVILDMRMPVLDGWGFVRALGDRGIHLPIVVMTAAQDASTWADEIGAAGFVAKPFEFDELLDVVGRLAEGDPKP